MLKWNCKHYNSLTIHELYEILQLRQIVFVVEQYCAFLDIDDKDQEAWHLLGRDADTNQLLGYARLMQQGASYSDAASIGRIVTHPKSRHSGAGQALMEENLRYMQHLFPNVPIRIGAQFQLVRFYERFGFQTVGEAYTEDTILHIEMVLKK